MERKKLPLSDDIVIKLIIDMNGMTRTLRKAYEEKFERFNTTRSRSNSNIFTPSPNLSESKEKTNLSENRIEKSVDTPVQDIVFNFDTTNVNFHQESDDDMCVDIDFPNVQVDLLANQNRYIKLAMDSQYYISIIFLIKGIIIACLLKLDYFKKYKYINCYIPGRVFFPTFNTAVTLLFGCLFCLAHIIWNNTIITGNIALDPLMFIYITAKLFYVKVDEMLERKKTLPNDKYIANEGLMKKNHDDCISYCFQNHFLKAMESSRYKTVFYYKRFDERGRKMRWAVRPHRNLEVYNKQILVMRVAFYAGVTGLSVLVVLMTIMIFIWFSQDRTLIHVYPGCFDKVETMLIKKNYTLLTFSTLTDPYRMFYLFPADLIDNISTWGMTGE